MMEAAGGLLDADSPETVRLSVVEAQALALRALHEAGFSGEDANIIVDQLIDNSLCGYRYAGLPRILTIVTDEKKAPGRQPVRIVHETPLSALIDGGNNVGYIAAFHGAVIAARKAKQSGMASVGVYNAYYSGRNAYYVDRIVREGLVAIHIASAEPRVLPPGGAKPALGTNPIAFGFPSREGPIILDIGTASLMTGDLRYRARIGELLPEGLAFDEHGRPTRDPEAALRGAVVPFGGHKGYGLSFAVQALGLLAGAARTRDQVQDFGFLFLAIDPAIMLPSVDFAGQVSELVATIKATPRQPGVDEIRIPSERASRERERRRREGIVLERKVVDALRALCGRSPQTEVTTDKRR
jgi:LDH2 family malate/lactate/ureidoglycolate dehydrogenase